MDQVSRSGATIRMGELSAASDGALLQTLLGSCVGLALFDRRQKIGGLAHIVLPAARGRADRPGKFVDTAIPALVAEMRGLANDDLQLAAKLAGGASMFAAGAANIGQQNVESCERLLKQLGIPVLARHCGGQQGRRMVLDTTSGKVTITIVGQQPLEL